jgi:hypothetical protein
MGMLRGYSISACSNALSLPAKLLSSDALLMSVVHCTSITVLRHMWQWLLWCELLNTIVVVLTVIDIFSIGLCHCIMSFLVHLYLVYRLV